MRRSLIFVSAREYNLANTFVCLCVRTQMFAPLSISLSLKWTYCLDPAKSGIGERERSKKLTFNVGLRKGGSMERLVIRPANAKTAKQRDRVGAVCIDIS